MFLHIFSSISVLVVVVIVVVTKETILTKEKEKTYTGAQGIAAANLGVSRKEFERTNDLTRLGRCCANICARNPPRDVPYICT